MLERSVLAIRRRPRRTTNSIGRSFVKFSLSIDPRIDILISVAHLGRPRIEKRQVNKCFFNGASRSSLILRPIVPNLSTIQQVFLLTPLHTLNHFICRLQLGTILRLYRYHHFVHASRSSIRPTTTTISEFEFPTKLSIETGLLAARQRETPRLSRLSSTRSRFFVFENKKKEKSLIDDA